MELACLKRPSVASSRCRGWHLVFFLDIHKKLFILKFFSIMSYLNGPKHHKTLVPIIFLHPFGMLEKPHAVKLHKHLAHYLNILVSCSLLTCCWWSRCSFLFWFWNVKRYLVIKTFINIHKPFLDMHRILPGVKNWLIIFRCKIC